MILFAVFLHSVTPSVAYHHLRPCKAYPMRPRTLFYSGRILPCSLCTESRPRHSPYASQARRQLLSGAPTSTDPS